MFSHRCRVSNYWLTNIVSHKDGCNLGCDTAVWYVWRCHRNLLPPSGLLWKIHALSARLHGLTSRVGSVASALRIWNHTLFRPWCRCVYDLTFLAPVAGYLQPWVCNRHEKKNSHCLCFVILDSTNKNTDSFSEVNFIKRFRLVIVDRRENKKVRKYGGLKWHNVRVKFLEICQFVSEDWGRIRTHARAHTSKQTIKRASTHTHTHTHTHTVW
jgi:hypothetical protein